MKKVLRIGIWSDQLSGRQTRRYSSPPSPSPVNRLILPPLSKLMRSNPDRTKSILDRLKKDLKKEVAVEHMFIQHAGKRIFTGHKKMLEMKRRALADEQMSTVQSFYKKKDY